MCRCLERPEAYPWCAVKAAVSKLAELVNAAAPLGYDKYWLENQYIAWARNLEEPARNEDARFSGWVRSFTKGKPPR
jgi:hypothetical protein